MLRLIGISEAVATLAAGWWLIGFVGRGGRRKRRMR